MGRDSFALQRLSKLVKTMPADLVEEVLVRGRRSPQEWRSMSVSEMVRRLRDRFDMTQRQLAGLAGLPHSKVAKIETGQDVQISTLHQLFAGFGCGLVILPVSRLSAEKLWRRTHDLSDEVLVRRRRRYPRK